MLGDELAGVGIQALDVLLENAGLDPPLTPATDLDGREVAAADEGVDLGRGDVEDLGDIGEMKEPGAGP
jgi:hypothetical protein